MPRNRGYLVVFLMLAFLLCSYTCARCSGIVPPNFIGFPASGDLQATYPAPLLHTGGIIGQTVQVCCNTTSYVVNRQAFGYPSTASPAAFPIVIPFGAQAGDLALVYMDIMGSANSTISTTQTGGWTFSSSGAQFGNQTFNAFSYRILNGSDGPSTLTVTQVTGSGTYAFNAETILIRPNDAGATLTIDASALGHNATTFVAGTNLWTQAEDGSAATSSAANDLSLHVSSFNTSTVGSQCTQTATSYPTAWYVIDNANFSTNDPFSVGDNNFIFAIQNNGASGATIGAPTTTYVSVGGGTCGVGVSWLQLLVKSSLTGLNLRYVPRNVPSPFVIDASGTPAGDVTMTTAFQTIISATLSPAPSAAQIATSNIMVEYNIDVSNSTIATCTTVCNVLDNAGATLVQGSSAFGTPGIGTTADAGISRVTIAPFVATSVGSYQLQCKDTSACTTHNVLKNNFNNVTEQTRLTVMVAP